MSIELIPMQDGDILDWSPADGHWALNLNVPILLGLAPPIRAGQWASIRSGHSLVKMGDGKVLDWVAADGTWRLWNYDPTKADILPGSVVQAGQWASIRTGHRLTAMHDGKVLDWNPADGTWRLWNYDPKAKDILPGSAVQAGQWASVRTGHHLVAMPDGKVLDWVPADGTWRLWNYDPTAADVLPGGAVNQGHFTTIGGGHKLVATREGNILDWVPADGSWRLWAYDPKHVGHALTGNPIASGRFGGSAANDTGVLTFDLPSITFASGWACGGSVNLTLRKDGSFTYRGHFHDSGGADYDVKNALLVLDSKGYAFTFAAEGHTEGTALHIFGADRDFDWTTNGTNAEIAARWSDLVNGATMHSSSHIGVDLLGMLKGLVDEVEQVGAVVVKVIAVVGPLVA